MTVNGPVPLSSTLYVVRPFEDAIWGALAGGEWVLMLGPRQHGKTSFLIRLRDRLQSNGYRAALVDLQELPSRYTFPQLIAWFCGALAKQLGLEPTFGAGRADSLLDWLDATISADGAPVVILIDEASAIRDDEDRNAFYGQIRALRSTGAADPAAVAGRLRLLFAGTFRPESLVDDLNSPFNVCRRFDIDDLGIDGTRELVDATFDAAESAGVAELLQAKLSGQPNLIQVALSVAKADGDDPVIDKIGRLLEQWESESNDHIDSLLRVVARDESLKGICAQLVEHGATPVDPANPDFKYACVVGLARRNGTSLEFRSDVLASVARRSPQLHVSRVGDETVGHLFPLGNAAFQFMADVEYREIAVAAHDGAARAMQNGSHRLALVGYGTAMESILIDYLIRVQPATLAATIAAAPPSERLNFHLPYEIATDAATWRLVNLVKVGKLLQRVNSMEIPDSLRNFRNLVHPKVVKANYLRDDQLRPEAIAASGLIAMLMRDIARAGPP